MINYKIDKRVKTVTIRLTENDYNELIELAVKKNITKSEYVRRLIQEEYDKEVYNNGK